MEKNPSPVTLTAERADELSLQAGKVFTPRTPISHRELFAGRWSEIKTLVDSVSQTGLHVAMYGERGVGKTSLANVIPTILQVFDEDAGRKIPRIATRVNAHSGDAFSLVWRKIFDTISWEEDAPSIGFKPSPGRKRVTLREAMGLGDEIGIEDVKGVLPVLNDAVFVIDEFDRMHPSEHPAFTDLIKAMADSASPATLVLVGVAETIDAIIADHASIRRSLTEIHLRRMKPVELTEILTKAETALGMIFDKGAGESIVTLSQGLPHWTHLIGLYAVRAACDRRSGVVTKSDVSQAFKRAVEGVDHTITKAYEDATRSAQPGALYKQVLLACAIAAAQDSDGGGYFQPAALVPPLTAILRRDDPIEIYTFNKHLGEFCEAKRAVLQREGSARAFRYRFRDPLMPPFVLMEGIGNKVIDADDLSAFMADGQIER